MSVPFFVSSWFNTISNKSALWILMAWCFSIMTAVATVLITHPCVSSHLWVNNKELNVFQTSLPLLNIHAICLNHWAWEMPICISNLIIIGSDNGLSPGWCQAIIWTNAGILLFEPLGTNFREILIKVHMFSFKKIYLKMSSGKWRPFCLSLNMLMNWLQMA